MIADVAKTEDVSRRGLGGGKRKLRDINAVIGDSIGKSKSQRRHEGSARNKM